MTNKLPQIYSFSCPQAKKEQFTCPQVTKSQWLFTRCLLQRIQSHEMNGIQCFNHSFSQDMQLFKDVNMII